LSDLRHSRGKKPDAVRQAKDFGAFAGHFERLLDKSTAVTVAPLRAKFIVSVPMPQPISRTRLFRQRENSATAGYAVRRNISLLDFVKIFPGAGRSSRVANINMACGPQ